MDTKSQSRSHRLIDAVFVTLAAGLLLFPLVGHLAQLGRPDGALNEKRRLASFPDIRETGFSGSPAALDQYFADNFPYRDTIISAASLARSRWLKQPSDHVIVGEGSWLFYKGDDIFDDLMGRRALGAEALDEWMSRYEAKQAWLAEEGIGYALMVVPNKSTIHTDKLPWWLRANLRESRLQQIARAAHHRQRLNLIDLTQPIQELKAAGAQTYWFNDTHWSGPSLQLGLTTLFQRVSIEIPEIDPSSFAEWIEIRVNQQAGDLTGLLGLGDAWPRGDRHQLKFSAPPDMARAETEAAKLERYSHIPPGHPTAPIAIERPSGVGTAVIFHDSFLRVSEASNRFVDNHPVAFPFKRCVMIWSRPSLEEIAEVVAIEQPDIVIEQRVERLLYEGNLK